MTLIVSFSFFFNDPPTTEIYTLSLHDALPILVCCGSSARTRRRKLVWRGCSPWNAPDWRSRGEFVSKEDRKSTRLNSSHLGISYAVFCLKKKKTQLIITYRQNATRYTISKSTQ